MEKCGASSVISSESADCLSKRSENAHLLDIDDLVNSVVNSGLSPDVFEVEVELPRAKNVIEFAVGPTFLNTTTLFAKQAEQAVKLFAEYCPACSDPDYVADVPVGDSISQFQERVQLLEYSICPKCKRNRKELFTIFPNELVSCVGQRAGKTALTGGVLTPYILHRYLKIPNPVRYLGLMPGTMLQMTVVAVSAKQAYETLWTAIHNQVTSAPWFVNYHAALRDEEKRKGVPPGTLVKVLDSFVWYGDKKISATYQAADMKTLRGRTRLLGAIDELGWFNSADSAVRANADETYTALANSLRTVRNKTDQLWAQGDYDVPTAYMLNISSPRSQFDKIMSLLKEAERDPRKASFHWATWEASPQYKREDFRSEEINKPIIFLRDFGAQPPLADSPFIANKQAIYSTKTNKTPAFQTKPKYISDKAGSGKFIAAEVVSCDTDKQTARIITCDAGESGNCFAISLHHVEKDDQEVKLVLDGTVSVAPERIQDTDTTISIHFPTMFEIVLKLCKHFNIKYVAYDRWQSTGEIQRLRDLKIVAEQYSPKPADFQEFRNIINSQNYKMPRWEHESLEDLDITNQNQLKNAPYTHLALQMATVREAGKKVLKPEAGDDDMFRTVILASRYLQLYRDDFLKAGLGSSSRALGSLGVVIGKTTAASFKGASGNFDAKLGVVRKKTRY
jgi:hypothetical protein